MSVSTELKHEWRFVYYYEHEYYGLLAKCERYIGQKPTEYPIDAKKTKLFY